MLTIANDKVRKRVKFQGIPVDIEWPAGSVRTYRNSDYRKQMYVDYGYVPKTDSEDGEELDVYLGPDQSSDKVFVVEQLATGSYEGKTPGEFDEYKIMLGFSDEEEAKNVYVLHTSEAAFGGIDEMSLKEFKASYLKEAKDLYEIP